MIQLLFMLAAIALPFVAMPLLWRRMKSVRRRAYERSDTPSYQPAWQEPQETENGLSLSRTSNPNDDLIALGAREKQATWTITNP